MVLLEWLYLLLVVLIVWFIFAQIIKPFLKGVPLFPIFRRKRRLLEAALEETENEIVDAKLECQIRKGRQAATLIRKNVKKL